MITLYGVFRSRASRPLWLLYETGLPFHHAPVIQASRLRDPHATEAPLNTASPSFLRISPQGQIPVMEHDGLILTESLAITAHIARHSGSDLAPQTPAEQAMAEQWALFAATAIEPPALEILLACEADPGARGPGQAQISAEKLRRPLNRLEQHLKGQDWLIGGRFTVADLNTAECLRYAQAREDLLQAWPATLAWLARCQARPGFQRMWQQRMAEPA